MTSVRTGLEVLLSERLELIAGKRIGLITNHTGVNRRLESTVDLFAAHPDLQPVALFGPEHGLRGDVEAGDEVADVVAGQTPRIAVAVDHIVEALTAGGRLIYAGAGTSGRIALLDAAECPPTFGTDPDIVQALMAGGGAALAPRR